MGIKVKDFGISFWGSKNVLKQDSENGKIGTRIDIDSQTDGTEFRVLS